MTLAQRCAKAAGPIGASVGVAAVEAHQKHDMSRLLSEYLPDRDGRTSGERLQAIAGRALADGVPRIESRLGTKLLPEERNDARGTLVYAGLRCVLTYDETRDAGTGRIPQEIRFGRFAYLRMRLALIDWERKTFGDRRPGRTRHPQFIDFRDDLDRVDEGTPVEDAVASREQVAAWRAQAAAEGLALGAWIVSVLDAESARTLA